MHNLWVITALGKQTIILNYMSVRCDRKSFKIILYYMHSHILRNYYSQYFIVLEYDIKSYDLYTIDNNFTRLRTRIIFHIICITAYYLQQFVFRMYKFCFHRYKTCKCNIFGIRICLFCYFLIYFAD